MSTKSKKSKKDKKPRVPTKLNQQTPHSLLRKMTDHILAPELQHARDYPIVGCWIMSGWQASGLAPVIVAREQSPGKVMFGSYMVDLLCLGVKDVYTRTDYSRARFERDLPAMCMGTPEKCSVELAHEVIWGSIAFAEHFGFQPHRDFERMAADLILDPPDAHPRVNQVVFGRDGRPVFIAGPYDDQVKTSMILSTLKRTAGEGNYDFMTGMGPTFGGGFDDFDEFDDDDDEEDEVDDENVIDL
jgi:hypothetical protein